MRMSSTRFAATALVIAALGLATGGCSSTKAPSFRVTDAQLASRTAETSVIVVTIEGENPNPDALPLYAVHYSASVDGRRVLSSVERSPERTLARFSKGSFTVPIVVSNDQIGGPVALVEVDGSVVYQLPGTIAQVFFDNDIRRPSEPFAGELSVNLDATVVAPMVTPPPTPAG